MPEGDALSTALAQALPPSAIPQQSAVQAATAGATFETLIRDAAGPAPADTGGIEAAPLTSTTGASTTSLSAVRASPLAQPLPMPADPSAGFDDGLSTRIAYMAEQGIGRAQLRHARGARVRLQLHQFVEQRGDLVPAFDARRHRRQAVLISRCRNARARRQSRLSERSERSCTLAISPRSRPA